MRKRSRLAAAFSALVLSAGIASAVSTQQASAATARRPTNVKQHFVVRIVHKAPASPAHLRGALQQINSSRTMTAKAAAGPPPFPHAFPSWCGTGGSGTQIDDTGTPHTLTEQCASADEELDVQNVSTGTVVGVLEFTALFDLYEDVRSLTFHSQIGLFAGTFTGSKTTGFQDQASLYCADVRSNGCTVSSVTNPRQPFTPGSITGGYATLQEASIPKGVRELPWSSLGPYFSNSDPDVVLPGGVGSHVWFNNSCDNALGGGSVQGCKDLHWVPTQTYSRSGAYSHVAENIRYAELHGAPQLIQRTTDSSVKAANNAVACAKAPSPRPAGMSCDEYPYASSYQGARYFVGRGVAEKGCGMTLPTSVSGSIWGACLVPATENSNAGSSTNTFYKNNRVNDGDQFNVVTIA